MNRQHNTDKTAPIPSRRNARQRLREQICSGVPRCIRVDGWWLDSASLQGNDDDTHHLS